MAPEQGAQQLWSSTLLTPFGGAAVTAASPCRFLDSIRSLATVAQAGASLGKADAPSLYESVEEAFLYYV